MLPTVLRSRSGAKAPGRKCQPPKSLYMSFCIDLTSVFLNNISVKHAHPGEKRWDLLMMMK